MKTKPIRILQIVPNMQAGGLESLIMNLYRHIDRNKVQFDFLVHYKDRKFFDDEIESLGGKIYRFSLRDDNNIFKYKRELNKFFKQHKEYKVIHCHMSSIGTTVFKIAKKHNINVRIAHSHNSSTDKTLKGRIKRLLMLPLKKYSTVNFACSNDAGKFLFGNKPFTFFENAINIERFKFNQNKRDEYRKLLNIEDKCFVIGCDARFNIQKNHIFLLKVFKQLMQSNNVKLLLIGKGEREDEIRKFITENSLQNNVIILQNIKNIEDYYCAMDCFVLPSLYEGLPLVAIQAQASGLPCYFSDKITTQTNLSGEINFLPIDNDTEFAGSIKLTKSKDRLKNYENIYNSNFNIIKKAKEIENFYLLKYGDDNETSR